MAELKIRLNAEEIGVTPVMLGACPAVADTELNADGANEPNVKPLFCLKKLKPTSLSTERLNSTTRTSTCTTARLATVEVSNTAPSLPSEPSAATTARW